MKKFFFAFFIFVTGCNKTDINAYEQPVISFFSSCGGFLRADTVRLQKAVLANDSINPKYRITKSEYVVAEQIRWHYNISDSILDIIHFRKVANCAAKWITEYHISGTTLFLEETNNAGISDRCECVFDQFCSIKISDDVNILTLAGKKWTINLKDTVGILIIDTTSLSSLGVMLN